MHLCSTYRDQSFGRTSVRATAFLQCCACQVEIRILALETASRITYVSKPLSLTTSTLKAQRIVLSQLCSINGLRNVTRFPRGSCEAYSLTANAHYSNIQFWTCPSPRSRRSDFGITGARMAVLLAQPIRVPGRSRLKESWKIVSISTGIVARR